MNNGYNQRLHLLFSNAMALLLREKPFFHSVTRRVTIVFKEDFPGNFGIGYNRRQQATHFIFNPTHFLDTSTENVCICIEHLVYHLIYIYLNDSEHSQDELYHLAIDLVLSKGSSLDAFENLINRGRFSSIQPGIINSSAFEKAAGKDVRYMSVLEVHNVLKDPGVQNKLNIEDCHTIDVHNYNYHEYVPLERIFTFRESVDTNTPNDKTNESSHNSEQSSEENKKGDSHSPTTINVPIGSMISEEIRQIINEVMKEASKLSPQQRTAFFAGLSSDALHIMREMVKPKPVKDDLRKFISKFVKRISSDERIITWSRVNRKYPHIIRGKKKERKPRILIGIDTSGSMFVPSVLKQIYAEVKGLISECEHVDIIMGDVTAKKVIDCKKQKIKINRGDFSFIGGGCTDLQFIWDYAKGKGNYDGIIVHTDGYIDTFATYKIPTVFAICPGGQTIEGFNCVKMSNE